MIETEADEGSRVIIARVTLSRRNLLALLSKLDCPGSMRTLVTDYGCPDGVELVVTAEDDEVHYANRPRPGRLHPVTEAQIEAEQRRN